MAQRGGGGGAVSLDRKYSFRFEKFLLLMYAICGISSAGCSTELRATTGSRGAAEVNLFFNCCIFCRFRYILVFVLALGLLLIWS